jgi:O-succinylbenzoate synthase
VKTWIDFDDAAVFSIPLRGEIDGRTRCEGMLIEGPQGWGEFSPPTDCDDENSARWLTAAIEVGTVGWPDPVRGRVPVAVSVPPIAPADAAALVVASGCSTASVSVATGPAADDIARLEAVRDALGPAGSIRIQAGGRWDLDTAVGLLPALQRAAGGLEFVLQPCRAPADVAAVRRTVGIPVAVTAGTGNDELSGTADIAVLRVSALGGVRRALRIAETCGLPCVVAASVETSIGTAGGLALAGVLPDDGYAHELAMTPHLSGDVVSAARSLIPVDGMLPVAPMPPAPDPERLESFRLTDPTAVQRWRSRLTAVERFI